MDVISSRWRKPKNRLSKKKLAAVNKAKARWSDKKSDASLAADVVITDSQSVVCGNNELSTSSTKLQSPSGNNCANTDQLLSYAFINMNIWNNVLENVKCSECLSGSLHMNTGNSFGFSTKFELKCKECDHVFGSDFTSPRIPEQKQFDINKKLVEAFLRIGRGHAALEIFPLVLGIQTMDKKTFSKCLNNLSEEGKDVKKCYSYRGILCVKDMKISTHY